MIANVAGLLLKYRTILLTACVLGVGLGLFAAHRQSRAYLAVAVIQLPGGRVSLPGIDADNSSAPSPSFIQEASTIKDDQTLDRVISDLHLAENGAFLQLQLPTHPDPEQRAELHDRALTRLRDQIRIQVVGNANLLRLSFESPDPRLAAAVINHVIDDFADGRYKFRYQESQQATAFMGPRLATLANQVQQQQLDLLHLQQELGSTGLQSRQAHPDDAFKQLVDNDVRARLSRIATQSRLDLLRSSAEMLPAAAATPALPSTLAGNIVPSSIPSDSSPISDAADHRDTSTSLRLALDSAQQQAALLSATLGPQHPSLQAVTARAAALQSSLDLERRSLLAAASADEKLAALREHEVASQLDQRNHQNAALAPVALQRDAVQRDYLFSRALYLRFLWRLRIASISKAFQSADVTIVDRATVYRSRVIKPSWTFIARYLAITLVAAAFLIFQLERSSGAMHQRLASLEGVTGLRVLSTVPWTDRLSLPQLISALKPASDSRDPVGDQSEPQSAAQNAYLESIFELRALLGFRLDQQPAGRIILFTSAVPSEGKTTLSTSLAIVLSRRGQRVLLIDADLRKPSVQRVLRLSGRPGLSTLLNGKSALSEALQHLPGIPTLDILGSGPIPPETTDLLTSPQMQQLLSDAAGTYDHVIIDSPPILAVTDSLLIAQLVDAVVWVVKDRKVGHPGLLRARSLLENAGAPVVGIAVNSMQSRPAKLSQQPSSSALQRFRRA